MSERAYGRLLDKCEKLEADNARLRASLLALVYKSDDGKWYIGIREDIDVSEEVGAALAAEDTTP